MCTYTRVFALVLVFACVCVSYLYPCVDAFVDVCYTLVQNLYLFKGACFDEWTSVSISMCVVIIIIIILLLS